MQILEQILFITFYLISGLVAFYFLLPTGLFVLHYLAGGKKDNYLAGYKTKTNHDFEFAAIITAHQDTRFIAPFVDSFLKQEYAKFKVYVVADDCDVSGLHFTDERIIMLKPEKALHSKIKSIQFAIDHFTNPHDVLIIFDSDNLVHPLYLQNLNRYFQKGFRVVQTHMLSKNIDNTYARLDSMGHIYYTFYERQVKMQLGMSSAILGLGIALDFNLYKEINYKNVVGGFDKKLQAQLAIKVKQIAFADDAIVYDEKVEDAAAMEKQRTRWIYSYFDHFKDGWRLLLAGIKTGSAGRLLLGATMLRPPMILLIFAMIVMMTIAAIIQPILLYWWAAIMFIFVANFTLTIATQSSQKGMFQAISKIPLLISCQLKALLKLKKAKTNFLKTEHQKIIYIDDLLKNELDKKPVL